MRDFPVHLDPGAATPLFVQIAQALAADAARGRLRPGDALPGTRSLAATLGVHRSTVVAAYAELAAQGWTAAKPGGATYLAAQSPEPKLRRFAPLSAARGPSARRGAGTSSQHGAPPAHAARTAGFAVGPSPVEGWPMPVVPPGAFRLWGGTPDLRVAPVEALARACRRVTKLRGKTLLGYSGHHAGHPEIREAIARLVSTTRGLTADPEAVLVTRGSQMALDLVARSLIAPGDVVAVEALAYPNAVNVFRRAGARIVPVPIDRRGLDVEALTALSRQHRIRLVYVTPHHQYPTTVTLAPTRRLALLEHARRERMAIVEDDYDQEFHYDGRPIMPLASNDPHGNVIYVGTFAKCLAPGLRLAFAVAPQPVIARMTAERALIDRQGDAILECAVAEMLTDGEIQRHVRRMRRLYHERRDAFCEAMGSKLGHVLDVRPPAGGLQLWVDADRALDLGLWQQRAAARGVFFQIGAQFTLDGSPVQSARFGFATLDARDSVLAVRRLAEALPVAPRARGRQAQGEVLRAR